MGEGNGSTLAKSLVPSRDNVKRRTTTCTRGQFYPFSLEGGHARHRDNMQNPHSQLGPKKGTGRCQNCQSVVSFWYYCLQPWPTKKATLREGGVTRFLVATKAAQWWSCSAAEMQTISTPTDIQDKSPCGRLPQKGYTVPPPALHPIDLLLCFL